MRMSGRHAARVKLSVASENIGARKPDTRMIFWCVRCAIR
jgi:hypothetical protein